MAAADVLQLLANSDTKLSDALRSAILLSEVKDDENLLGWLQSEVSGWNPDDVPDYRIRLLESVGDASNGAWRHLAARIPIQSFSEQIRIYAGTPIRLVQSVGTLEDLLAGAGATFQIPWSPDALARLNWEIHEGGTGVDDSYHFDNVRRDVPRPVVRELLEYVRHRALDQVARHVPRDQLEGRLGDALPATPSHVAVQGSGNQVIVGSPGASVTLTIHAGDRTALDEALAAMGIDQQRIVELHDVLDEPDGDQSGKVVRVLAWCRTAAKEIGVNTAGSAAATTIFQYLGLL